MTNSNVPDTAPRQMGQTTQGYMVRQSPGKVQSASDVAAHITDGATLPIHWFKNPKPSILKLLGLGAGTALFFGSLIFFSTLVGGKDNSVAALAKGAMFGLFEIPGNVGRGGIQGVFGVNSSRQGQDAAVQDRENAALNGRSLNDQQPTLDGK